MSTAMATTSTPKANTLQEFAALWTQAGESTEDYIVQTAWERYQQVHHSGTHHTTPESDDPSADDFQSTLQPFLTNPHISSRIAEYKFISLPAKRMPWTHSGINANTNRTISTFTAGRIWRSRLLDLFLRPQFYFYCRIGVEGRGFNGTGDTNTFVPPRNGELFIASQFPGQFGDPTGRVVGELGVYDGGDGRTEVLVVVWKEGVEDVAGVLQKHVDDSAGKVPVLVQDELRRLRSLASTLSLEPEWKYFSYIGNSSIYNPATVLSPDGKPCIHCKPYQNAGILQHVLSPTLELTPQTSVSWSWLVDALPSRVREDTTFSHDYLSVAFEFENGRDITYTWSWNLPEQFGYWCPLPTWTDREYHVVVRSGEKGLGEWQEEERNLWTDYVKYIEEGKERADRMPQRVVKVWLIATNWWQRHRGEMLVKGIRFGTKDGGREVVVPKRL